MRRTPAEALAASAPDWVTVEDVTPSAVVVQAVPRNPSGRPGRRYRLRVEAEPVVKVYEAPAYPEARLLPAFCPERHVNGDTSFCLGLKPYGAEPHQLPEVWETLRAYLLCQDYAAIHSRWPSGRWLSHGAAAAWQLQAETAAASAGLSRRYERALEFGEGWLAGPLIPRGVARMRTSPPSPRRLALEALVAAERRRRSEEAAFTRAIHAWGDRCCGTMKACPLRDLTVDLEAADQTSTRSDSPRMPGAR